MEFINVETTLFNIIGWSFLLGAAATVLVPILVWIGNFICDLLWHFIDEGDTEYEDKGTALYFADRRPPEPQVVMEDDFWVIRVDGRRGNFTDTIYIANDGGRVGFLYSRTRFTSESLALKCLEEYSDVVEREITAYFDPELTVRDHMYLNFVAIPLGLGFLFIPTITLVAGSAMLSLYALRWGRRGVKLALKVKKGLESHISDKDAHKE